MIQWVACTPRLAPFLNSGLIPRLNSEQLIGLACVDFVLVHGDVALPVKVVDKTGSYTLKSVTVTVQ